jgi:hypothetical protein
MGTTAWVLVAFGLFFWPLILIGILACQEEKWQCPDCGEDLGPRGEDWLGWRRYDRDD